MILIDMSSIAPLASREIAAKVQSRRRHARCPVSGVSQGIAARWRSWWAGRGCVRESQGILERWALPSLAWRHRQRNVAKLQTDHRCPEYRRRVGGDGPGDESGVDRRRSFRRFEAVWRQRGPGAKMPWPQGNFKPGPDRAAHQGHGERPRHGHELGVPCRCRAWSWRSCSPEGGRKGGNDHGGSSSSTSRLPRYR